MTLGRPGARRPLVSNQRFLAVRLLLALFLLAPALSVEAASRQLAFGQGLLWRVERPGELPSHIFGTMHSADPEILDLPPAVEAAFGSARSLTLEVVMDSATQMAMTQSMLLIDGRRLEQITGPQRLQRLVQAGSRYGLGRQQIQMFRPWALLVFLSVPPSEYLRQSTGQLPLDQMLQKRASERGLPLHSLETIEEQIMVFAGLPERDLMEMLDLTVALNDQIEPLFVTMKKAYLAGDTGTLHRLKDEMSSDTPAAIRDLYDNRLIHHRNGVMVERMIDRLEEGRAFVAVGALHLAGEQGVLNLLAQQGYKITRVH